MICRKNSYNYKYWLKKKGRIYILCGPSNDHGNTWKYKENK